MLFVNAETSPEKKYANAFLEGGRKLVWFPSTGQTRHHPLIKRMLSANEPIQQQSPQQDQVPLALNSGLNLAQIVCIREPSKQIPLASRQRSIRAIQRFSYDRRHRTSRTNVFISPPTMVWHGCK